MFHLRADQSSQSAVKKHAEELLMSGKFSDLGISCDDRLIQVTKEVYFGEERPRSEAVGSFLQVHKAQFSMACPYQDLTSVNLVNIHGVSHESIQVKMR